MNFKKLRPRVTVLKQSKVIEELQNIATAEPPLVEQLRRTSVFLQKPERPIPTPRKKEGEQEDRETESYKVVIKKQKRRSVTDRLLERGLLKPEGASTPEPFTPEVNMESKAEKVEEEEEEDSSILDPRSATCSPLDDDPRVSVQRVGPRSSSLFETRAHDVETDGATASRCLSHRERVASKRGSRTSVPFPRRLSLGKWRHVAVKGSKCWLGAVGRGVQVSRGRRGLATSRRGVEKCSKSRRIEGRSYLETYLRREEDNWRVVDGMFGRRCEARCCFVESSSRRRDRVEEGPVRGVELSRPRLFPDRRYFDERSRRRILHFKGRYVQRILRRDAVPRSFNRILDAALSLKRNLRARGENSKDWTWYLAENASFDRSCARPRKKFTSRARYVERILERQFECLGLIANRVRRQLLQLVRSDSSRMIVPSLSSFNSRHASSSLSPAGEGGVLSDLVRSSKDYISAEIFHRGSRRSRSSRASSGVSSDPLDDGFRTFLPIDRSFHDQRFGEGGRGSDKTKAIEDNDRDGRRLSFVPTVLYESLTNRIGVDFTRLVAYAFVPCTSIILLYMYK